MLLLLLSGDIQINPGPYIPKYPCMMSSRAVKWKHKAVCCDSCNTWCNIHCMDTTELGTDCGYYGLSYRL